MNKKQDISVACCWWGNWPTGDPVLGAKYVNKLYRMMQQYLTLPHRFVCFVDNMAFAPLFESDIEIQELQLPESVRDALSLYFYDPNKEDGIPILGHFPKLNFFRPDNGLTGRVLGMDLDTVISGSMNDFVIREEPFLIRQTFARRRRSRRVANGIGGGMVSFDAGQYPYLWLNFTKFTERFLTRFQGDEREMYAALIPEDDLHFWQKELPGRLERASRMKSIEHPRDEISVIAFTGFPHPHEAEYPFLQEYWHDV